MKKRLLLMTLFTSAILGVNAQVPNGDFELWTDGSPDSWSTQVQAYITAGQTVGTLQVTGAEAAGGSGSSVSIETIAGTGSYAGQKLQGRMLTLKPHTEFPKKLAFDYKNELLGTDTSLMVMGWYDAAGTPIATYIYYFYAADASSEWKHAEIKEYDIPEGADLKKVTQYQIQLFSTYCLNTTLLSAGSKMSFDNFEFTKNIGEPDSDVGISKNTLSNMIVFPNPASNVLTVDSKKAIRSITIYTMDGRAVAKNEDALSINVSALPNAMYYADIETVNGIVSKTTFVKN